MSYILVSENPVKSDNHGVPIPAASTIPTAITMMMTTAITMMMTTAISAAMAAVAMVAKKE